MEEKELKKIISNLLEKGEKLSDIQEILKKDHNHYMTFMELRLLSSELKVNWKKFDSPIEEKKPLDNQADLIGNSNSEVEIELSKINQPGFLFSGTAKFSSGELVHWYLDQLGQLTFKEQDIVEKLSQKQLEQFQKALKEKLS